MIYLPEFDLVVNGRALVASGIENKWVCVKDGIIRKVSTGPETGDEIVRLKENQLLLPAGTDLHVHLRDWGQSTKETVESGTRAALAGGITTLADMPNTDPPLNTPERVKQRIELLKSKAYTDFAVHAGVPENAQMLSSLKEAGAFALKFYPKDLNVFPSFLEGCTRLGIKCVVHAEDPDLIGTEREYAAEGSGTLRVLRYLQPGADVRFAHVSLPDMLSRIFTSGLAVSEVSPHHLLVSAEECAEGRCSVRPPLRTRDDVMTLRALVLKGLATFFASDHAPHTTWDKEGNPPSPGFIGVEFIYPLLLTEFGLTLTCKLLCENPARYLGIRKGKIEPGYIADFVVFERKKWLLRGEDLHSLSRNTPFLGRTMDFKVTGVYKGGAMVYQEGAYVRSAVQVVA